MRWTKKAEEAVAKVPFFVRKRVRRRIEKEAEQCGDAVVTIQHVRACKQHYLNRMEDEVRGYHVETCFGSSGCPNRAIRDEDVAQELETILSFKGIRSFLQSKVRGTLKMHHEFQVTVADCPNACSRPQIADAALIGASIPGVSAVPCTKCGICVGACHEGAITLPDGVKPPVVDMARCVSCGQCVTICPTGTLVETRNGYRILVGGKLGRHPQLARELPGVYSREKALKTVEHCVDLYKRHAISGERFGEVINRIGINEVDRTCRS